MSPKRFLPLLSISLILAGCTADLQIVTDEPAPQKATNTVAGEAILLLSETAADEFADAPEPASLAGLGIRSIERVFPDAGEFEARHRTAGLHRWYRVSYDPSVPQTKAGDELGTLPGVEAVTFPPRKVRTSVFNDPELYHQWHYINQGQEKNFVPGIDINVEPVWEQYTAGSRDVIVAVIDGGVDYTHPDLDGVVLSNEEGSRCFVYGYSADKRFKDDHGTHVAGTIAAINNNGIGVCGVAGGRDGKGGVRIMSCAIFGPSDFDDGDDAAALVWAADHGAVIANNSWGATVANEEVLRQLIQAFIESENPTRSAIDYFIEYAGLDASGKQVGPMAGGLVVFAAGNEGNDLGYPASYDPVVAVGAFGPSGKMSGYSNYGSWVDLMAPGGTGGTNKLADVLSSVPRKAYDYYPGTSMAAPHVSGVAALLVSHFGGPGFTNEMLEEALVGGSIDGILDLQGHAAGGKLDALGAFQYMLGEHESKGISISATDAGDRTVKSHEQVTFRIRITGNKDKLPVSVESDFPGISAHCNAFRADVTLDALKAEPGDYSFTVRVGNREEKTFSFTILPNHAPQQIRPLENCLVNANSAAALSLDLGQYFQDPDDEVLSFDLNVSGDPILTTELDPEKELLTVKPAGYGLSTLTVTALDARGAKCAATFQILARDGYRALDIFPNPVTDWLHVRPATEQKLQVELFNRLGARVYASGSVEAGPFKPLDIDMQGMPGGVYTLRVNGENFTVTKP
jgi:hypothetical protein